MGKRGRPFNGEWHPIQGGLIFVRKVTERETAMVARFKSGETLEAIGADYGITRERVRQILKKNGLTKLHGGIATTRFLMTHDRLAKQKNALAARDARCRAKWGLTLDQYLAHVAEYGNTVTRGTPMRAYMHQRKSASARGIDWEFSFAQWWQMWQESGRWAERGRGKGYCMARHGDSGAYNPGNVYICTCGQNFSDSWLIDHPGRKKGSGLGFKIRTYTLLSGDVHYMVELRNPVNGKRWYGSIKSRAEAVSFGQQLLAA